MKKTLFIIASVAIIVSACTGGSMNSSKLKSTEDSLAYALGVNTYHGLKGENIKVDPYLFAQGMRDSEDNGKVLMDPEMAQTFLYLYFQRLEEIELQDVYKEAIAENQQFLNENKKREGVIVTESGLQYEVVEMGTGEKPLPENTVRVHYTGKMISGEVFDSSIGGDPAVFPVTGVIRGWVEALQLMPVGSKFILYIPYDLAYGPSGAGGVIPPFATLIFDVELLEIVTE